MRHYRRRSQYLEFGTLTSEREGGIDTVGSLRRPVEGIRISNIHMRVCKAVTRPSVPYNT